MGLRLLVLVFLLIVPSGNVALQTRGALDTDTSNRSVENRFQPPPGYKQITTRSGSFSAWLLRLPVRLGKSDVRNYKGQPVSDQSSHVAVLDVDVGGKNLQQCADAVIRLRAEYLYAGPCADEIKFNFTSGHAALWKDWCRGIRPRVDGNKVAWEHAAALDSSYVNFREYLDTVFMYAGSASLERELLPVRDPSNPQVGDIFIQGGFPGHAVIVIDVAENSAGEYVFLLAQSFMPAQDIHILKSFDEDIYPWYRAKSKGDLITPHWIFSFEDLKRFPGSSCEQEEGRTPD